MFFQLLYFLNANYESKCVIERGGGENKSKVFAILNRGVD